MMWVVVGGASLMAVAMVVAWWEHVGRVDPADAASSAEEASTGMLLRAVTVDVSLDALEAESIATPTGNDGAARKMALDGALVRMARTGSVSDARPSWLDTTPMISAVALADTDRQPAGDATAR